jgi:hypothetical protein
VGCNSDTCHSPYSAARVARLVLAQQLFRSVLRTRLVVERELCAQLRNEALVEQLLTKFDQIEFTEREQMCPQYARIVCVDVQQFRHAECEHSSVLRIGEVVAQCGTRVRVPQRGQHGRDFAEFQSADHIDAAMK